MSKNADDSSAEYLNALAKNINVLITLPDIGEAERQDNIEKAKEQIKEAYNQPLNSRGDTLLLLAVRCAYEQVGELIIKVIPESIFSINHVKSNLLHSSAYFYNKLAICKILINKFNSEKLQEYINAQDDKGETPLHIAAGGGLCPEIALLLLQAGADENIRNNAGETVLERSASVRKQYKEALENDKKKLNSQSLIESIIKKWPSFCKELYLKFKLIPEVSEGAGLVKDCNNIIYKDWINIELKDFRKSVGLTIELKDFKKSVGLTHDGLTHEDTSSDLLGDPSLDYYC